MKKYKNKFLNFISDKIDEFSMVERDDRVLVAVSGGADSVALLYGLIEIVGKNNIGVAHFNHLLRGDESDRDEKFVETLTNDLKIPFFIEREDVQDYKKRNKLSLEDAARVLRYNFLEIVAQNNNYQKIATAHHSDDNAELVIMNLLRGSGQLGLTGIPPVRGNIIRPLIGLSKKEILCFLDKKQYINDSSNFDQSILRNKIRHDLLPYISENYNPSVSGTLNRLSSILRVDEDYLANIVDDKYECIHRLINENEVEVLIDKITCEHDSIKMRIIRKAIESVTGDLKKFSYTHIQDILNLINKDDNKSIDLPAAVRVCKTSNCLIFRKYLVPLRSLGAQVNKGSYNFEISSDTEIVLDYRHKLIFSTIKNDGDLDVTNKNIVFFDKDTLELPLKIRKVQYGDCFKPYGLRGTQKIKKFFNAGNIPENLRWNTPVIINNDEIIWLCGHRSGSNFLVTKKTRAILKIELSLA
ncbi:MAG: tRNA lysidine(34) synthetase TilS [Desulfobacterales bacterium]|nr:tRNA lysidine(34) synthetase TilS [Desulfobacterales bacterium]MCP4163588.1 tRNA lysidine(34) synthetase TilS [Deltaproteobacteria bacterium]